MQNSPLLKVNKSRFKKEQKQNRFETCIKDWARTGYEMGPVKEVFLDEIKFWVNFSIWKQYMKNVMQFKMKKKAETEK